MLIISVSLRICYLRYRFRLCTESNQLSVSNVLQQLLLMGYFITPVLNKFHTVIVACKRNDKVVILYENIVVVHYFE